MELLGSASSVTHWLEVVLFAEQVDLAYGQLRRHRPSVFPAIHRCEAHTKRFSHRFLGEVQPFTQLFDSGAEIAS